MLVVLTAAALGAVRHRVLRGRRRSARLERTGAIVVGVGAWSSCSRSLGGIFWPGRSRAALAEAPKLSDAPDHVPTTIPSIPATDRDHRDDGHT